MIGDAFTLCYKHSTYLFFQMVSKSDYYYIIDYYTFKEVCIIPQNKYDRKYGLYGKIMNNIVPHV